MIRNYFKVADTGPMAGKTARGSVTKAAIARHVHDAFVFFDDENIVETRAAYEAAATLQHETGFRASLSVWREPACTMFATPTPWRRVPIIGEPEHGASERVAAE